jgi:hypothetical protein|tara:strand:+ start:4203 stop:4553 length:351 start_codon:yes stop_codon:yes gene_type:complete
MYKFKTKYKSCFTTIDELQYIKAGDSVPNIFKDNAPKQKQANYNYSIVAPVARGKYIPIQQAQLTGKGVSNKIKIMNEYEEHSNDLVDGHTSFGVLNNCARRRLFKKDNIIYDLIT